MERNKLRISELMNNKVTTARQKQIQLRKKFHLWEMSLCSSLLQDNVWPHHNAISSSLIIKPIL